MYLSPCISPSPRHHRHLALTSSGTAVRRDVLRHSFHSRLPSSFFSSVPALLLLFLLSLRSFKSLCASLPFSLLTRNGMHIHPRTGLHAASSFSLRILYILTHVCFLLFLHLPLLPLLVGIFPLHSPVTTHTNDAASQPRRIVEPVGSSRAHRLLH